MNTTVSDLGARIAKLRKKSKKNQKQVANDLGISQALLSHYENGIRECGLDFLKKIADYYKVSCDFLLGRDFGQINLTKFNRIVDSDDDSVLSLETLCKIHLSLLCKLSDDERLKKNTIDFLSVSDYLLLNYAVKNGLLPNSWLGSQIKPKQLDFLNTACINSLEVENENITNKNSKSAVPTCIKTLEEHVYEYFHLSVAKLM